MKQVIRKAYWDVEKEENWLNSMSAMGMALIDYSQWRYVFENAQPNEYIYRIELLQNHYSHADSIDYVQFLEDNGIECVARYMRWIYLRKKTVDGPFDIYTDMDSRYRYYKRLSMFYFTLFMVELAVGLFNLVVGFLAGTVVNLVCAIPVLLLALLFAKINLPIRMKIRKYEQEKIIRE